MQPADLISLVITTYNRSDALLCVLQALVAQTDTHFEIVIADDGSTPQHQDAIHQGLRRLGLQATHVWHPDVGFTASRVRNIGVLAAQGRYIVLMDGDCVPETDFVSRHRALAEAGCFVNGSRVMLSQELTHDVLAGTTPVHGQHWRFWVRQRLAGHASKVGPLLRLPDMDARKQATFRWKGIRSCNMALWREDYAAVNGFDESFVGWGHEDADIVLRLHNAGKIRKNGFFATEVYHLWHPQSSRAQESHNADRVRERMLSGQHMATIGYRESAGAPEVVRSTWG